MLAMGSLKKGQNLSDRSLCSFGQFDAVKMFGTLSSSCAAIEGGSLSDARHKPVVN